MLIITKRDESEDIEFMHKCHEVDMHKPNTWNKYPNNIYHLSVACLHAWRLYNGR